MRYSSGLAALAFGFLAAASVPAFAGPSFTFKLVVSPGVAARCLPNAHGEFTVTPGGEVDVMKVKIEGLPPSTDFDLFIIQVPHAPFGLSWYQGDIDTNASGEGVATFVGRFSRETFILAPGKAVAPKVFPDDATSNPITPPVQTYHLGVWFDSPKAAIKAGCPGTVTKFNGTHNAGIQVLNTSNRPDLDGPLRSVP